MSARKQKRGRRSAQRQRRPSSASIPTAVALSLAAPGVQAGPHPPLPTPCVAGTCGSSASSFVQYGNAAATPNGNTLTVTQSTAKAILNWADFNIANGYTVNFAQPSTTAAVLNKIWSADPSVIAGALKANGQVYLYNQNGIVFDKGAQVDVGGLVATTIPLQSDDLFKQGILNNGPTGPAFQQQDSTVTPGTIEVNSGATLNAADDPNGKVILLGSAVTNHGSINTPDGQTILGAATKNVYLAASTNPSMRGLLIEVDGGGTTGTVTNAGQITAARGNITLAGLMVNQEGLLSATTSVTANGSIYLVAGDVSQTAVTYHNEPIINGQQAAFGGLLPNKGGNLVLAPGSVTQVSPDPTDTATLTASQRANFAPSEVELAGGIVALEGNATVKAPGGNVNVWAGANPDLLVSPGSPTQFPNDNAGRIYLDRGSSIDVSGLTQVAAPATQNVIQVTLETNDLQNDPLLRTGFLHGAKVTVNLNNPWPTLFDVQPYVNNIGTTLEEILTTAGNIHLNATGNVIARAGSTLNVSGGSIAYQAAQGPSPTQLLGADGKVYNINTAPDTVQYVGFANSYSYTDPTWGTSIKGNTQTYYPGYIQGESAGTVEVDSPQVYLRGSMLSQTVVGSYQRNPTTTLAAGGPFGSPTTLAAGGTFVLGCPNCATTTGPELGADGGITFTDNLQDDLPTFTAVSGAVLPSPTLPSISLLSPTQLAQAGFDTVKAYTNGQLTLPLGTTLTLGPNGSLVALAGKGIEIDGNIKGAGASVALQTTNVSITSSAPVNVTLGAGAIIDVSGSWINDSPAVTLQPGTAPTTIDGGQVTLSPAGNVVLGPGSVIDVSGGGWINQKNKLTAGKGGTITLAGNYLSNPNALANFPPTYSGTVDFGVGATLLGGSLAAGKGGTLALQSGSVTVGSTTQGTPGELLLAPDFFTQGGFANYQITGQNDVIIGNLRDVGDSAPITVAPIQQNLVFTQNSLLEPTGTTVSSFTHLTTLPAVQRQPASISFITNTSQPLPGAGQLANEIGDVSLAKDASLVTDPGGSVMLAANGYNGNVRVLGSITAPAGTITLQLTSGKVQSAGDPGFIADQQIELGPSAMLATPGYAKIDTLDPQGYREGSVLDAGTVWLNANKGFIVTAPGSVIDVSGVAGVLDLLGSQGVAATTVAGKAGTITLDAREGMALQGKLLGQAAALNGVSVSGAGGGTLNLGLGNNYNISGDAALNNQSTGIVYPTDTRVLTLVGSEPPGQMTAPTSNPLNPLQSGTARVDVGILGAGGFDNLEIRSADVIAFEGAVTLHTNANLSLDAPVLQGHGTATNLSAAHVTLGNYYNNPDYYSSAPSPNAPAVLRPQPGDATLTINAQLIDIRGVSSLSGFGMANLVSSGDLRVSAPQKAFAQGQAPPVGITSLDGALNTSDNPVFEGALNISGNLLLQAAQVYPTTATQFAINALPPSGTGAGLVVPTRVVISTPASGTTPVTPLSAAGSLTINATDIEQGGVLRAPFGQIALNGDPIKDANGAVLTPGNVTLGTGSLTSVSADGLLIPYGSTVNGTQWKYSPAPGYNNIVAEAAGYTNVAAQAPVKEITLNGTSVSVNKNATVDLSGGGDLYAYEFIAGRGGSTDVLDPANLPRQPSGQVNGRRAYSYAVVPTLGSSFAPLDPQYDSGSPVGPGQTIYLSGVPGLAAGTYALLPARYALLPGAYAVQMVQSNSNVPVGSPVQQPDGSYVVGARFGVAGTSVLDSLSSTVLVASGSVVRNQSQYSENTANVFFSTIASNRSTLQLPADAGQFLLTPTSTLNLNSSVNLTAGSFVSGTDSSGKPITQSGRAGDVAIVAQNLLVTDTAANQTQVASGTVQLDVQQLDSLNAQTLILGASARPVAAAAATATPSAATAEQLDVGTIQVELSNTAALTGPEIIVAARNNITLDAGAKIVANGTTSASALPQTLLLADGGALLRASNGAAATLSVVQQSAQQNPTGTVKIGSGASVQAPGSLLLYGTGVDTSVAADAQISAPAVGLYSSHVSLGDPPATSALGLTLSSQLLNSFKGLTDLTLGSTSTIDFYGAVQLGTPGSGTPTLHSISLDAAGLNGYGAGDKILQAGSILWTNSSGGTWQPPATSPGGMLELSASSASGSGQLTLGAGSKTLSGFSALQLRADGNLFDQGTGTLDAGSARVTVTSSAIMGAAGSSQTITTSGAVMINRSSSSAPAGTPGLGAELTIQASDIAQNGSILMPAGIISLSAQSGNVTLGSGSVTNAAGADKGYTVTDAVAPGGTISLAAGAGNVVIQSGATVDVSGATSASGLFAGGAGTLNVSAPQGMFSYAGSALKGGAPSGAPQGSFTLDVGQGLGVTSSGNGFTDLSAMLSSSGFSGDISLRTRTDHSVVIDSSVNLQASSFALSADNGLIDVQGTVNTSGGTKLDTNGGSIALWAGKALTLEPGSQLLANAGPVGPVGANGTALATRGGDITLGIGALGGQIDLQPKSIIQMRGSDANSDGTLTLRAPTTLNPTTGAVDVSISEIASTITGRGSAVPVIVEGYNVYYGAASGATLGGNQGIDAPVAGAPDTYANLAIATPATGSGGILFSDAQTFVNNSSAIASRLLPNNGNPNGLALQVRPGIEIDGKGDLNLQSNWDLNSWNAALGTPVNLTLRAAGNLIFSSSLSDGFAGALPTSSFGESASNVNSASYRLTAGADLTAANPLAVVVSQPSPSSVSLAVPNSGNVIVTPNNLIRTGNGNIDIAAGADVLLGYAYNGYDANGNLQVKESDPQTAAIYTAGVPSVLTTSQAARFLPTGKGRLGVHYPAAYPTGGGNINITAADDIRSAISAQMVTDWLWRRGTATAVPPNDPSFTPPSDPHFTTSWWVMFNLFQQGIGALGGGSLSLSAGRDIVNTSAVIPTTGRQLVPTGTTPVASDVLLTGGGTLRVVAGGDVISGVYEDDWGNATIAAGGALTSSVDSTMAQQFPDLVSRVPNVPWSNEVYPVLVVGNGVFDVSARTGITLDGVANSTTMPTSIANYQAAENGVPVLDAGFFAYAPTNNPGTLNLLSSGGNIVLGHDSNALPIASLEGSPNNDASNARYEDKVKSFLAIYPSTLSVAALSGDIDLGSAASGAGSSHVVSLFPASQGNLNLLAARSIHNDGSPQSDITVSEADPAQLPSPLAPVDPTHFNGASGVQPPVPLHQNDSHPISLVAATGDIDPTSVVFPKAANLIAGGNISNLLYLGKNLNPADVTLIMAGGDISYSILTEPVSNALLINSQTIQLGGPGYLEVLAGGSINLGDSIGVLTTGNLQDLRLPSDGASLLAGAGFGKGADGSIRQPAYQSFITTYLAPDASGAPSAYAPTLESYMQKLYPQTYSNVSYAGVLSGFESLTSAQQLPLLAQVLTNELSQTGLDHTLHGTDYSRGFNAIHTLFPTKDAQGNPLAYSGDINMYYSQLKTELGGDIDLLVPGGSVVVGVPNPAPQLNRLKGTSVNGVDIPGEENLGVLVLGQGAIQGFADQSFIVNQSRMLTLEGGDIILWASTGDINAGNGAKSVLVAPPPQIETDNSGNLFVNPSNAVAGSGIGQILSKPGIKPGLVNLIAPNGAVNAGDAGIRVAGNLNIAAVQVIGASNITVGGTATGVPVSEAGALSGALSGANSLGDAGKSTVQQLSQDLGASANYQQLTESLTPAFIVVKMFCLGVECEAR